MKKIALILALGFIGCDSGKKTYTEEERDARVDSLFALRLTEIEQQAAEDLDRRKSIEVKAKVDSILQRAAGADKTDVIITKP